MSRTDVDTRADIPQTEVDDARNKTDAQVIADLERSEREAQEALARRAEAQRQRELEQEAKTREKQEEFARDLERRKTEAEARLAALQAETRREETISPATILPEEVEETETKTAPARIGDIAAIIKDASSRLELLRGELAALKAEFGIAAVDAELFKLGINSDGTSATEDANPPLTRESIRAGMQIAYAEYQDALSAASGIKTSEFKGDRAEALQRLNQAQQRFALAMRIAEIRQVELTSSRFEEIARLQDSDIEEERIAVTGIADEIVADREFLEEMPPTSLFESRLPDVSFLLSARNAVLDACSRAAESSPEIARRGKEVADNLTYRLYDIAKGQILPMSGFFEPEVTRKKSRNPEADIRQAMDVFQEFASSGLAEMSSSAKAQITSLEKELAAKQSAIKKIEEDQVKRSNQLAEMRERYAALTSEVDDRDSKIAAAKEHNANRPFFGKFINAISFGRFGSKKKDFSALEEEKRGFEAQMSELEESIKKSEAQFAAENERNRQRAEELGRESSALARRLETARNRAEAEEKVEPIRRTESGTSIRSEDHGLLRGMSKAAQSASLSPEVRRILARKQEEERVLTAREDSVESAVSAAFFDSLAVARAVEQGKVKAKGGKFGIGMSVGETVVNNISIPILQQALQGVAAAARSIKTARDKAKAGAANAFGTTEDGGTELRDAIIASFSKKIYDTYNPDVEGQTALSMLNAAGLKKFSALLVDDVVETLSSYNIPDDIADRAAIDVALLEARTPEGDEYRASLSEAHNIEIDIARLDETAYRNALVTTLENARMVDLVSDDLVAAAVHARSDSRFTRNTRFSKTELANPGDSRKFTYEGLTGRSGIIFPDGTKLAPEGRAESGQGLELKYGWRKATRAENEALSKARAEGLDLSDVVEGYSPFTSVHEKLAGAQSEISAILRQSATREDGFVDETQIEEMQREVDSLVSGYFAAKTYGGNDKITAAEYFAEKSAEELPGMSPELLAQLETHAVLAMDANYLALSSDALGNAQEDLSAKKAAAARSLVRFDAGGSEISSLVGEDAPSHDYAMSRVAAIAKEYIAQRGGPDALELADFLKAHPEINSGGKSRLTIRGRQRDADRTHFKTAILPAFAEVVDSYDRLAAAQKNHALSESSILTEVEDVELEISEDVDSEDLMAEAETIEGEQEELSEEERADLAEFQEENETTRDRTRFASRATGAAAFAMPALRAISSALPDDLADRLIPDGLEERLSGVADRFSRFGDRISANLQSAASRLERASGTLSEAARPLTDALAPVTEELNSMLASMADRSKPAFSFAQSAAHKIEDVAKAYWENGGKEAVTAELIAMSIKLSHGRQVAQAKTDRFDTRMKALAGPSGVHPSELTSLPGQTSAPTPADVKKRLVAFCESYHAKVMSGADSESLRKFVSDNIPIDPAKTSPANFSRMSQKIAGLAAMYSDAKMERSIVSKFAAESVGNLAAGGASILSESLTPALSSRASGTGVSAIGAAADKFNLPAEQRALLEAKAESLIGSKVERATAVATAKLTGEEVEEQEEKGLDEMSTLELANKIRKDRATAKEAEASFSKTKDEFLKSGALSDPANLLDPDLATIDLEEVLMNMAVEYAESGLTPDSTAAELSSFFNDHSIFNVTIGTPFADELLSVMESYKAQYEAQTTLDESKEFAAAKARETISGKITGKLNIRERLGALASQAGGSEAGGVLSDRLANLEELAVRLSESAASVASAVGLEDRFSDRVDALEERKAAMTDVDGVLDSASERVDGAIESGVERASLRGDEEEEIDPAQKLVDANLALRRKRLSISNAISGFAAGDEALETILADFAAAYETKLGDEGNNIPDVRFMASYITSHPEVGDGHFSVLSSIAQDVKELAEIEAAYEEAKSTYAEHVSELSARSAAASVDLDEEVQVDATLEVLELTSDLEAEIADATRGSAEEQEEITSKKTTRRGSQLSEMLREAEARDSLDLDGARTTPVLTEEEMKERVTAEKEAEVSVASPVSAYQDKSAIISDLNDLVQQAGGPAGFIALTRVNAKNDGAVPAENVKGGIKLPGMAIAAEGKHPCYLVLKTDEAGMVVDVEVHGGDRKASMLRSDKREFFADDGSIKPKHAGVMDILVPKSKEMMGVESLQTMEEEEVKTTHAAKYLQQQESRSPEVMSR